MGQYYNIIFLADTKGTKEIIRLWIDTSVYGGVKLMEHAYIGESVMNIVEFMLSPKGMFYKGRLVWAGDNAEKEPECSENLYEMAQNKNDFRMSTIPELPYRYIVNHTKQQYVDKNKVKEIHPLALLVAEGGAGGGGDYYGKNDHLCGTWSRDVISMENEIPNTFLELECEFE